MEHIVHSSKLYSSTDDPVILDAINSLIFVRYRQTTLLKKYELTFFIIWRSKTFWK